MPASEFKHLSSLYNHLSALTWWRWSPLLSRPTASMRAIIAKRTFITWSIRWHEILRRRIPGISLWSSFQMDPRQFVLSNWFWGVLFPYNGQVALWQQQAGRPEDNLVIWDYHVIVVLRLRANYVTMQPSVSNELPELCVEKSWIYDYDTLLPKPCRWQGQCCSACVHCAQGSETHSCDRLRPFNFFI